MEKIIVGIKVIITKGDNILVLKRAEDEKDSLSGLWDIPGGKLKFGETYTGAIYRIVEEKTGMKAGRYYPLSLWSATGDGNADVAGVTVVASYQGGEVALSPKNTEFKWIYADEFGQLHSYDNLRKEIEKYAVM